jgi:hypothetical protein
MGLVAEVLANGGYLPQLAELHKKKGIFNRKNGVMLGVFWFMFWVLILTPMWGIADVEEMAAVSAVIGVFGSFMIILASLVFLRSSKSTVPPALQPQQNVVPPHLYGRQNDQALPPASTIPASDYAAPAGRWRVETDDLARPGSVTEGTTRLLEKDRND